MQSVTFGRGCAIASPKTSGKGNFTEIHQPQQSASIITTQALNDSFVSY
ncbi:MULTISPECIES: hypothetical protein [unclassified Nodularia (in: cyanobacteria)]|nr:MULTISPECIES: hypothetical protein [unclassified Nodularia (in: cyanobacteria)]MBE9199641.1 hypothetical protein [Nodularia sp. LEGE 06071]MCC2692250.1 hypothetical protein [Nodularia sp. LEGE 04288]